MKTIIAALLLVFGACAVAAGAAEQMETPKDMVLLTVGGEIANTNRGPFDPQADSLFSRYKIDFERAFAFDRAMLLGLKQGSVTAQPNEFKQPVTFTGPLLKEVLAAVGAARARLSVVAVNNYVGWLSPEDIDSSDWILALTADGKPLDIGQQGPLWLLNTREEGEKPSEYARGHWVWAVMYLHVGDQAAERQ